MSFDPFFVQKIFGVGLPVEEHSKLSVVFSRKEAFCSGGLIIAGTTERDMLQTVLKC